MSPNEFQLRAALREGEGDGVDVGAVLANAAEIRRRRRRMVSSISGGVAIVALVGVGGGLLLNSGGSGGESGGGNVAASQNTSAATAPAAGAHGRASIAIVGPKARGDRTNSAGNQVGGPGSRTVCPAQPVKITPPAAGAPGANGPLFARPVTHLTMCSYNGGVAPQSVNSAQISGDTARELVSGIEQAKVGPSTRSCAQGGLPGTLEILATAPDRTMLDPVVVAFACSHTATVTNGTAVRYQWNPPPWVLRIFVARVGVPPGR